MYKIHGATHKGMLREHNEDRYTGCMLTDNYGYALVCDGMGGESGGSIASTAACEEIRRLMETSYRDNLSESSIYMIMETALDAANTAIYRHASPMWGTAAPICSTRTPSHSSPWTTPMCKASSTRAKLLRRKPKLTPSGTI
ncbi:MAG: hypothetical protein RR209_00365 [Angelakisella sp.]